MNKRCCYECSISEVNGEPSFHITIKEEGYDDEELVSRYVITIRFCGLLVERLYIFLLKGLPTKGR